MPFQLLRDEENQYEFAVFTPENFGSLNQAPIIVFLHGSGERGWDPGLAITRRRHFPPMRLEPSRLLRRDGKAHVALHRRNRSAVRRLRRQDVLSRLLDGWFEQSLDCCKTS